jgi:hypothetical protein
LPHINSSPQLSRQTTSPQHISPQTPPPTHSPRQSKSLCSNNDALQKSIIDQSHSPSNVNNNSNYSSTSAQRQQQSIYTPPHARSIPQNLQHLNLHSQMHKFTGQLQNLQILEKNITDSQNHNAQNRSVKEEENEEKSISKLLYSLAARPGMYSKRG